MKNKHIAIAALVVFAAAAALAVSAVYVREGGQGNPAERAPAAGEPTAKTESGSSRVAAFVLHGEVKSVAPGAFKAADGTEVTLADWHGKAVLVNLWATWCAPCRHEMPALDRLQARLGGDDFEVVAISLDRGGMTKPKAFYEEIGIEHLALYNDETAKLGNALGAVGMPTTLLLDADGREVGRMAGPAEWDSDEAIALIARAVGVGS